jgi:hypothetical protein
VNALPPPRQLPANRCDVCGERERDRHFLPLDLIAYANGLLVPACAGCWTRWPHGHKHRADDPARFPHSLTEEKRAA